MKNKLSPEDQALFREAMKTVRPLARKKVQVSPLAPPVKAKPKRDPEAVFLEAPFSDAEYLEVIDSEGRLEFSQPGFSKKLLRDLRRGLEGYQAVLDLHGKTVEEARQALQQFITACRSQGILRTLVIHGKGHGKTKPILKNKLNHWLRQSEEVLAFCSARQADGGSGAIYLRLKSGG